MPAAPLEHERCYCRCDICAAHLELEIIIRHHRKHHTVLAIIDAAPGFESETLRATSLMPSTCQPKEVQRCLGSVKVQVGKQRRVGEAAHG